MIRSLVYSLATLASFGSVSRAQLVVRVEANGAAVFGAEVAVWSDSGRLAVGRTEVTGIVRFPVSLDQTPIQSITARRVGFSPARLTSPAADSVTLWLTKGAADLPAVAVKSRPLQCPSESEADAVALWRRVASRYTAGQDTMAFSALGSSAEETVTAQERGFGEPPSRRFLGYLGATKFGNPNEYLFGTYHPPIGPAYDRWTYPSMMGSRAGRLASAEFGEQHTFLVLSRAAEATTLGFCARNRSGPDIDGELDVGADTVLLAARWTFRVPHHQEEVGGEATFGAAVLDGARYLVAVTSSQWREVRPGLYDQQRTVLEAWKFGHTREQAWLGTWNASGDRSGTNQP